jgi:Predicted membrane protein
MNTNQSSGPLVGWTEAIYALHALSLLTGILGAATIVGAFLIGWPSIIAVIFNYVKRSEVRGTWLESHFLWQIRTFWYGLLWVSLCIIFVVLTLGIGIIIVWLPIAIVSLWFVYRIARGWIALRDGRPMYS